MFRFTIRDLLTWTLSICAALGAYSLIPVMERHNLPVPLAALSILGILAVVVVGRLIWRRWARVPNTSAPAPNLPSD